MSKKTTETLPSPGIFTSDGAYVQVRNLSSAIGQERFDAQHANDNRLREEHLTRQAKALEAWRAQGKRC